MVRYVDLSIFLFLAKNRYDGVYIGLNDRNSESRFRWSDGSNVMYTNWGVNEPNSYMNHNEDCVEVKLSVMLKF